MSRAWRDYIEPDVAIADRPEPSRDVPRPVGLHHAAQIGWSPQREGGTIDVQVILNTGERVTVAVCPECYSGVLGGTIPEDFVCLGCLRYAYDQAIADILAIEGLPDPDPPEDE